MASNTFRVEITRKSDPRGDLVKEAFHSFGLVAVQEVEVSDLYYLAGDLSRDQVESIARDVLCDPVVEHFEISNTDSGRDGFEILYNLGVTDPKEESVRKAISDIGIQVDSIKTGNNYIIKGDFNKEQLAVCAELFLYNPLVQHIKHGAEEVYSPAAYELKIIHVGLDGDLLKLSRDMGLSLNQKEMETIKHYYDQDKREPTDVELETIAQTWSEHCRHKTFLGRIVFDGQEIDNLLKDTIMRATREINHPMCLSVFHDNSGVIDFDEEYGVCFKVETHNHPSALE
ncbi:MAG: phosphoribosylformylglycinamidine synthase subunit PurS, partial [candidate division WOR-3 bacterium]